MLVTREDKKREAIERMKILKLHSNVIRDFREDDKLNMSENGGFLYWLDEAQQELVREFEEQNKALVYHVLHNIVGGDEHLAFLYVSDYEEEWEYDREDLLSGYPLAYVKNLSYDIDSEFGSIGVKPNIGGLCRTA